MNSAIQHFAESFYDERANSGKSFGKSVGAKKHHHASFGFGKRSANSAAVAANQIELQLADLFLRDANFGKFAESGVDAIGGFVGEDDAVNYGARGQHFFAGCWSERDLRWRLKCGRRNARN